MSPIKKRRRYEPPKNDQADDARGDLSLEKIDEAYESVKSSPKNPQVLLQLARVRYQLTAEVAKQEKELANLRGVAAKQLSKQRAFDYESEFLDREIERFRTRPIPFLTSPS